MSITDPSRASTPTQGPSTTHLPTFPRRLNYFDFSHFAHVHHGILGDRDEAEIADYDVARHGAELRITAGPFIEYTDNVKNSAVEHTGQTYEAWKRYRVCMPNAMKLNSSAGATEDFVLCVAVAPVNRRRTRCFTFVARNYAFDRDQEFHDMQYVILSQDQPIVESQRPEELPVDLTAEMHVKGADLGTVEYRRWLISIAGGTIDLAPAIRRPARSLLERASGRGGDETPIDSVT